VALDMARVGADLAGVAAFHAGLTTSTPAAPQVKAQLLVQNGAVIRSSSRTRRKRSRKERTQPRRITGDPASARLYESREGGEEVQPAHAYNAAATSNKAEMAKFFAEISQEISLIGVHPGLLDRGPHLSISALRCLRSASGCALGRHRLGAEIREALSHRLVLTDCWSAEDS